MKEKNLFSDLFQLAVEAIDKIDNFKKLSKLGKFEVLLLNTSVVLNTYRHNHPISFSLVQGGYFDRLDSYISKNSIDEAIPDISDFMNNRFVFYADELNKIFDSNYIPGKVFNAFYEHPFSPDPEFNYDLPKMILFSIPLKEMCKNLQNEVNQICSTD